MSRALFAGLVSCWLLACSYHRDLPLDAGCSRRNCERDADVPVDAGSDGMSRGSGSSDPSIATGTVELPVPGGDAGEVIAEPIR